MDKSAHQLILTGVKMVGNPQHEAPATFYLVYSLSKDQVACLLEITRQSITPPGDGLIDWFAEPLIDQSSLPTHRLPSTFLVQ